MKFKQGVIGVVGSGAMGSGIAQVAATAGHTVKIFDTNSDALVKAKAGLEKNLAKLEEKGKLQNAQTVLSRFEFVQELNAFHNCDLIIEAIVENLKIKQEVFSNLEKIVREDCVLATNTSSLSVTSIAAACEHAERVVGIHFFNPAPLMALVEIIPAIQTDSALVSDIKALIQHWQKVPVVAKDTPGFIVNRVARPFYSEAIKLYEEGFADIAVIDKAMTQYGGFKMGPFTLMDYIGHDVNYVVTATVYESFFNDPRFKPYFSQKRLLEAKWLGRKTGRGFYNYTKETDAIDVSVDEKLGKEIVERIVCMLINEAVDALYLNVASAEDLDLAVTKGVNYPKGLLAWCDEIGADYVLAKLDTLYKKYGDDRYRACALLRKHGILKKAFIEV